MILTTSVESAMDLAQTGNFLSAVEVLGDRWPGLGVEPDRNGESDRDYARLLMVCGYLTLNIGALEMRPVQTFAKDMLSRAARLFGGEPGEQQARLWLGVAYLRCGENAEALALMDALLAERSADVDVTFSATLTKAVAYLALEDTQATENELALIEILVPAVLPISRGKFYLNQGMLHRQRNELDAALNDYALAADAFRDAASDRYEAAVENNRARIYTLQGRLHDAEAAAARALSLFQAIRDQAHEAKAWDELARIHEAQKDYSSMEDAAAHAVQLLSAGDHAGWLMEALVTHGRACELLARQRFLEALAIADAQESNPDPVTKAMWESVTASKATERVVYERLLGKHGGRISPAAHEIGCGHQMLQKRLENHFPDLLTQRRPKRRRHKSLMTR